MTIHCHRTMHRGIALSLHGIIVIYSSHRLETNSSTQTSMERGCTMWPYPDHEKKNFWHVLMDFIFWWNMFFNQGFALVRIRLADAILCQMQYLSNTQNGRFCFKARTINIHLVSRYEGFKSMPNDYELLCLYTFEDRVKESSFVFRGLSSHSRIVHSYGDITITGEGLQMLSFICSALMAMSCEGSWHSHLLPSVKQWRCHYLFLLLSSVEAEFRTPNFPLAGRTLQPTAPPPRCLEKRNTGETVM